MRIQRANQRQAAAAGRQTSPAAAISVSAPAVSVHPILQFQQTIGNQAVQRWLRSRNIQARLAMSQPGDVYEQEADHVADHVMRMPEPVIQRSCSCAAGGSTCAECEPETKSLVQRKTEQRSNNSGSVPDDFVRDLGPGEPLDTATRAFFEPRFGRDFRDVRVHAGSRAADMAREIHASAFTAGPNIVFGNDQYRPESRDGQRLLAHELTHVVQQGGGSAPAERVQRQPLPAAPDEILIAGETIEVTGKAPGPPDDRQGPPVSDQKWVFKNNKAYWLQYNLDSVKPLRNYDPFATPKAYANRVYRAQKYLRAGNYIFREKKIALDGMLGPETILFLHYILQNENFSEAHFELTGLGFDREALSSAAARIAARQAEADEFPPKFLEEWTVETRGTAALSHIQDEGDLEQWYDRIIFGGAAPQKMHNQELTLAHRHAIMLKAYENVVFKGLAALVEVERDALHNKSDNMTLVRRHYKTLENVFWISYSADTKSSANKHDKWFELEYPTEEIRKIRQSVGTKTKRKNRTYLTGLLTPFFIPKLTETERARLQIVASEYFRERAENIENFIVPRAGILLSLIRDTDTRREIRAHKVENELMDFFAHPDVFEKFADYLTKQGNFEELVTGIERLRSVDVLELFVQLCMQTAYKNNPAVLRAHEKLMTLKRDIRSHDYVAGDREAQAVILEKDPDRKLKVGEVAGGRYIISEDRQRMKPKRQEALEEKMRALVMTDIAEKMGKEDVAGGEELSEEKYMEKILEKAAAELKIGEGDFEEVSYQEGYRLLGVKSVLQNGVEQFLVDYEKVNRMAGGAWQTMEKSSGYRPSREFEESLGWFKFANQMGTLETVIGGAAIVIGGVVLLASGAGGALIALGGGAKMVALSIGISVLIWAITAEHLTIEGFLQAVLDGYLMAVGFRAFSFVGRGVAKLIGTATFKQKLVGLLLQSVVTGGGAGAMTGPASLLIRDILAGKLGRHSAGDYFQAAKTGFIYGALFELGGSLIIGPLMRTAGKNVLERIGNIEQWKAFIEKSGIVLKPAQWGSEITKAYAGFKTWMAQNLEASIEQTIAKKFLQYSNALLESYAEGLLLTIHRQTLDLIEAGMTRESVNTLEQIITESHKKLPIPQANALVNEVLNQLARNPKGRVNQFFSLVNVSDNVSFQAMLSQGMKDLASADAILQLATIHPPATVRSLWQYHFQGNAAEFTAWLEKAALLPKEARQEIIRLLSERGSSVTPALLLRIAQAGAALSDDVVGGLVRLTRASRNMPQLEALLHAAPDNRIGEFLAYARGVPDDEVAHLLALADNPARGARLLTYADNPVQLHQLMRSAGHDLVALDALTTATRERAGGALRNLLGRPGATVGNVTTMVRGVAGDAALLDRTIVRMGQADVEGVITAAQGSHLTHDPLSIRRFLQVAERFNFGRLDDMLYFLNRVRAAHAFSPRQLFENALDALEAFGANHPRRTVGPPLPQPHGPHNLATPNSSVPLALADGTVADIYVTNASLQHFQERHSFSDFWFSEQIINRAEFSTFWPAGTTSAQIVDDAVAAIRHPEFLARFEVVRQTGGNYVRPNQGTGVEVGGTNFEIGVRLPARDVAQCFPTTGPRAVPVHREILWAIRRMLQL
jgi:hypothetical protein